MLVIQISEDDLDFDQLVSLEDCLIKALVRNAKVDGHDKGSGEINYFILTDVPAQSFKIAKQAIEEKMPHLGFRAAFRKINEEKYSILWPLALEQFRVT
jgi:hypothetical protein